MKQKNYGGIVRQKNVVCKVCEYHWEEVMPLHPGVHVMQSSVESVSMKGA